MNETEATNFFEYLSEKEKIKCLAFLSHELTILARDTYEIGTENIENQPMMREINEIQHRISNKLISLSLGNEGYASKDLMQMIFGGKLKKLVESVFSRVVRRFSMALT
jgi:hypothetical protein